MSVWNVLPKVFWPKQSLIPTNEVYKATWSSVSECVCKCVLNLWCACDLILIPNAGAKTA